MRNWTPIFGISSHPPTSPPLPSAPFPSVYRHRTAHHTAYPHAGTACCAATTACWVGSTLRPGTRPGSRVSSSSVACSTAVCGGGGVGVGGTAQRDETHPMQRWRCPHCPTLEGLCSSCRHPIPSSCRLLLLLRPPPPPPLLLLLPQSTPPSTCSRPRCCCARPPSTAPAARCTWAWALGQRSKRCSAWASPRVGGWPEGWR